MATHLSRARPHTQPSLHHHIYMRLMEIPRRWQKRTPAAAAAAVAPQASPAPAQAQAPPCPRGHFAAYARDGRRFLVPIACLDSGVFRELLRMAEEEFGAPAGGRPIVLPCSGDRLEHILADLRAKKGAKKSW